MDYTCKPIVEWPDKLTPTSKRKRAKFGTSYAHTLVHLERELRHLAARNVVFQLALDESEIRNDGRPRASARPSHPGVIITFNSKFGPLSYWTDQYTDWQANVRAISLALEALRAVDRHGVSREGSQYAGYKRLTAAPGQSVNANAEAQASEDMKAAQFVADYSEYSLAAILSNRDAFTIGYRQAATKLHPDN